MTLGTSRARSRPGGRTTTCPPSRSMASRRASGPAGGARSWGCAVGSAGRQQGHGAALRRVHRSPRPGARGHARAGAERVRRQRRQGRRADRRAARGGAGGDAGAPRPDHHAGDEGPARRGVLLRRDVLGAQVGQPAARFAAGQGAAGPSGWPGGRSGAVGGAGSGGVGRHHGRQPGDAGVPAAGGGLQPGRVITRRARAGSSTRTSG